MAGTYRHLEAAKKEAKKFRNMAKRKGDSLTYDRYSAVVGLIEQALKRLESL